MPDKTVESAGSNWEEKILLRTIVKIESINVYDHFEEDNDWPHYQVSADCSVILGGAQSVPGNIQIVVDPDESERLPQLQNILQPGSFLWATSKSFLLYPDDEQKIVIHDPELEPLKEEEQDIILRAIFDPEEYITL